MLHFFFAGLVVGMWTPGWPVVLPWLAEVLLLGKREAVLFSLARKTLCPLAASCWSFSTLLSMLAFVPLHLQHQLLPEVLRVFREPLLKRHLFSRSNEIFGRDRWPSQVV